MSKQPIILDEWMPVETPLGKGYAFLIETTNHENWYTVMLDTRAIVTMKQDKLLMQKSYTHGRSMLDAEMRVAIAGFVERMRNGNDPGRQDQGAGQEGPRLVKV